MGRARQLAGRGNNDSLLLDSSAASTDENERVLLDASAASTNAGFSIILEDSRSPTVTNTDTTGDAHTLTGAYSINSNNVSVGNRMIFTATGTFTKATDVPAHITHINVHITGGGGGGGGGDTDSSTRGAGGGGGGYALERLAISSLSAAETVTVGAAGTSGATQSSPTAGGTGGTSSFGSFCSATGGSGGSAASGGAVGGSAGGNGSGGDISVKGGSSYCLNVATHVSSGGNGAGPFGGGVAAANVSTAGNLWGGGGANTNHTASSTCVGAQGLVVVEW